MNTPLSVPVSNAALSGATWPAALGAFAIGLLAGGVLVAFAARWAGARRLRRVRAAEERARRAERLAEIGSMTRGLAHEIKNPLSTIGLNAQLLGEGVEDLDLPEEKRLPLLRRIESLGRETERLRGILTDFLEFAGELRIDPRPGDLNSILGELIDFFLPQAEQHGVRLRADLCPGELVARFDAQVIKQALLNLMLNAVQAMNGSGEGRPRELIIKSARGADAERRPVALVHVIDTGPGITPEVRQRLFTPYFTTKSGGTGLGLATARRIVEAHAGRIDLHTTPGQGSDFLVLLPLDEPAGEA